MSNRTTLIVSALLFLVLVALELNKPKVINWNFDLSRNSTTPLGCKVLYELYNNIFPDKVVSTVSVPPYNHLTDDNTELKQWNEPQNYLIIADRFAPDSLDSEKLLAFAASGNNLFIAANRFSGKFADTLNLLSGYIYYQADSLVGLNFTHDSLRANKNYIYRTDLMADQSFDSYDTLRVDILGTNDRNQPNFLHQQWQSGHIYLSSVPVAFTNYYLLHPTNHTYAAQALSYLPVANTFWDEYYKPNQQIFGNPNETPLRYILSVEALKWAMYIGLVAVLLFMLFEAKRKQRVIPVIKPLVNTTLEFTKTVGMLYYQNADHKDLALKKITYFNHFLRTKLHIKNIQMNETGFGQLSGKTGIDYNEIVRLCRSMQQVAAQNQVSEEQLLVLSRNIDRFYQQVAVH